MPQLKMSWQSDDGMLFPDETAATRHEVLRDLWKSFPDLKQSRSLIEARLPELCQIIAPLVPLFPRNHPEVRETTRENPPVAEDYGCDCAALMAGNGPPHHPTCPMFTEETHAQAA